MEPEEKADSFKVCLLEQLTLEADSLPPGARVRGGRWSKRYQEVRLTLAVPDVKVYVVFFPLCENQPVL